MVALREGKVPEKAVFPRTDCLVASKVSPTYFKRGLEHLSDLCLRCACRVGVCAVSTLFLEKQAKHFQFSLKKKSSFSVIEIE